MESIEEKKRQRFEFLRHLYEMTGGDTEEIVDIYEVGKKIELDGNATSSLVRYLIGEGLAQWATSRDLIGSGRSDIRITHRGIVEIEKALSHPEQATEYFPPVNIIYANTIVGASIQQGGFGNLQSNEYCREHVHELPHIIDSILKDLGSFNLKPDDEQQIRADLQVVRAQAISPKPEHHIIRKYLKPAYEILKIVVIPLGVQYADRLLPFLR
jgi:hypothetical protein